MEEIYEQSRNLSKDSEMIADNLASHNPGISKKVVPLRTIQCDIATMLREYSILYGKIGEKIKDDLKTKTI